MSEKLTEDRVEPERRSGVDLDSMLDPAACAAWLGIRERELRKLAFSKKIPAIIISRQTVRFHPRTILSHFQPKTRN